MGNCRRLPFPYLHTLAAQHANYPILVLTNFCYTRNQNLAVDDRPVATEGLMRLSSKYNTYIVGGPSLYPSHSIVR